MSLSSIAFDASLVKEAFDQIVENFSCDDGAKPQSFVNETENESYEVGIFNREKPMLENQPTLLQKTIESLSDVFVNAGFIVEIDEDGMRAEIEAEQIYLIFSIAEEINEANKKAMAQFLKP